MNDNRDGFVKFSAMYAALGTEHCNDEHNDEAAAVV
jgi:hypothetical protein